MTDREMILSECRRQGLNPDVWDEESENGLTARFNGNWVVAREDEDRGLYGGDEGVLSVTVVGAEQYDNRRVNFTFTPEGYDQDSGPDVTPFEDVDPL